MRNLNAIEASGRDLHAAIAGVDKSVRRLPGKGFVFMTVLTVQVVIGALIVYGDAIRPLIPLHF